MDLVRAIRKTNDYEREISGAVRVSFNAHMYKWRNDELPDKLNNNFFVPIAALTQEDIREAIARQQAEGHTGLMFRMRAPMNAALQQQFGFEEEVMQIMALLKDGSAEWKSNPDVVIRDVQTDDIAKDMLDVSAVPPEYRAAVQRSMRRALKTAKKHPEYHWLYAYKDGKAVGSCYALCKNGCVEMDDLEVLEAHRGQYVATTLMKHIAQNFDGVMYLHANAAETPSEMYAKMGFETVDTVYDYYLEW